MFEFPSAKKATCCPSGDQNGNIASSVRSTRWAEVAHSGRIQSAVFPGGRVLPDHRQIVSIRRRHPLCGKVCHSSATRFREVREPGNAPHPDSKQWAWDAPTTRPWSGASCKKAASIAATSQARRGRDRGVGGHRLRFLEQHARIADVAQALPRIFAQAALQQPADLRRRIRRAARSSRARWSRTAASDVGDGFAARRACCR